MKTFFSRWIIVLIILSFQNLLGQTKIIKEGDNWKFLDVGVPKQNWTDLSFDDKDWKQGPSPLGYGDARIKTKLKFGADPDKKDVSKFFRKKITVNNPFSFLIYELKFQRDDGIVIYLNGKEVYRNNMPNGKIDYSTTASSLIFNSENEELFHTMVLAPDDFIEGENVLSVSVHQGRRNSSDCLLNLELTGHNDVNFLPLLLKEKTLKNVRIESSLKELNSKMIIERKDTELAFIKRKTNQFKNALYLSILLIVLLSFALIYQLFIANKKRKKLLAEIETIKKINHNKGNELMNNSLNLVRSQNLIKEVQSDLKDVLLGSDIESLKSIVKRSIRNLDYNLDQNDDWIHLLNNFNFVHKGYLDTLRTTHKSLTEIELRHCVFIKLQMQTKEIAQVLNINPKSVQASRYRIKKKMNLSEDIDLRNYLLNFNA